MSTYIASPMSRAKIRKVVNKIRDVMGLGEKDYFDVVRFIEYYLHEIFPDFYLEIVPIHKMPFKYAEAIPETKCIKIREDVYDGAVNGNPRDRFTLAHEIGHLWLHRPGRITLARSTKKEEIPAYKCPEWQANTFAGELLVPPSGTTDMNVENVIEKFGVSYQVASIQMKQL